MFTDDGTGQLWLDVATTLSGREFRVGDGAYFEGELAGIEVVPSRIRGRDGLVDVTVIVTPFALSDDVEPEVTSTARHVFEQARSSGRRSIRAAAERELKRMDGPRLNTRSLRGRMLSLRLTIEDSWAILLPKGTVDGRLDRCGRARFSDIPAGCTCSLEADREVSAQTWELRAAAAVDKPDSSGLADLRTLRSRRFVLPDRRLVAVLEESSGGGATVSVETQAQELDGTVVRYRLGPEVGEVRLNLDPMGRVSGLCVLTQPYSEAERWVPMFEIAMAGPDKEGSPQ
jgi:hypothetical protein